MKASREFVTQLRVGLDALRDKYGDEAVAAANRWSLFWAIHDSLRPEHSHNAKVSLPPNEAFVREFKQLNDSHIETAMKAALTPSV